MCHRFDELGTVAVVMESLDIWRFDLGWRSPQGNHGLIYEYDGPLQDRNATATLLEWADSTRGSFSQHWYWVPIGATYYALIRISPQEGSKRGGYASTAQALVVDVGAGSGAGDFSALVDMFPPPPREIGNRASWQQLNPISALNSEPRLAADSKYENRRAIARSIMAQILGKNSYLIPVPSLPTPVATEIRWALQLFSTCRATILYCDRGLPAFQTANAPSRRGREGFHFSTDVTPVDLLSEEQNAPYAVAMFLAPTGSEFPVQLTIHDLSLQDVTRYVLFGLGRLRDEDAGHQPDFQRIHDLFTACNSYGITASKLAKALKIVLSQGVSAKIGAWLECLMDHRENLVALGLKPLWPVSVLVDTEVLPCLKESAWEKYVLELLANYPDQITAISNRMGPEAVTGAMVALHSADGATVTKTFSTGAHRSATKAIFECSAGLRGIGRTTDRALQKFWSVVSVALGGGNASIQVNHLLQVEVYSSSVGNAAAFARLLKALADAPDQCSRAFCLVWPYSGGSKSDGVARIKAAMFELASSGDLVAWQACLQAKPYPKPMSQGEKQILELMKRVRKPANRPIGTLGSATKNNSGRSSAGVN